MLYTKLLIFKFSVLLMLTLNVKQQKQLKYMQSNTYLQFLNEKF